MKIFASYDGDGNIVAFNNLESADKMPPGETYIEITKEQQERYFQDPTTCRVQNGVLVDNYVDPNLEAMLEEGRVQSIKQEAERRILAIAPEWKQRNMLARSAELADKKGSGPLTPDEIAEENAMRAVWAQIKEIRRKSDLAEAQGTQPDDIVW